MGLHAHRTQHSRLNPMARTGTQTWRLPELTIRKISVSEMDNNVYLLSPVFGSQHVLIDAADDAPRIGELIASAAAETDSSQSDQLAAVITTHAHWDHVRALPQLLEVTGARHLAGAADAPHLPAPVSGTLEHGQQLELAGLYLEVIGLRGHTPGSIALLYRGPGAAPQLFTGDSLFPGGVGSTQGDPARFASLIDDVQQRVFDQLPDETVVHPGHGEHTTLGAERPQLPQWRARGW